MHIRADISGEDWAIATRSVRAHMRPSLGRADPTGSCEELAVFGPVGTVWFDTDTSRAGYAGSVLYLCCFLAEWLRTRPGSLTLPGESIYQAPKLVVLADADTVRLRFERGRTTDEIGAPIDSFALAAASFVNEFVGEVSHRWGWSGERDDPSP